MEVQEAYFGVDNLETQNVYVEKESTFLNKFSMYLSSIIYYFIDKMYNTMYNNNTKSYY